MNAGSNTFSKNLIETNIDLAQALVPEEYLK